MTIYTLYTRFALLWGALFWTTLLVAQVSPPANNNNYVPVLTTASIDYTTDIAKSEQASYFVHQPEIATDKIARSYHTQNIFDIGEYDNPFALRVGKKNIRKAKKNQETSPTQILSDLFVLQDNETTQRIPKWLIFVLLGILSFMTILLSLYRKTVTNIFQAFFSLGMASNLYREHQSFIKIESFSSYILFALSMGTFCFLLPQFLVDTPPFNSFSGLLLCIVGIAGIYLLKFLLLQLTAFILPYPSEIGFYAFVVSITNKVIGYLLVPALFLLAYLPESIQIYWLYGLLGLLGSIYIYRSFRGFVIGGNTILFHKFHFFVYLCTIEIAPTIILLRMLSIL